MQERRKQPQPQGQQAPPSDRSELLRTVGRYAFGLVMLLAVIGFAISYTKPIYAGRAPVVGDVVNGLAPTAPATTAPRI